MIDKKDASICDIVTKIEPMAEPGTGFRRLALLVGSMAYDAGAKATDAEIAHLREKLAAAEKLLREAVEPGVFGIQDRSRISAPEDEMIRELGLQIGFGALMDSASRMWAIVAEQDGHPGSEFVVSACATTQKKWVAQVEELLAIIDGKE